MNKETMLALLSVVAPLISAVLVAVLNNWEKINPGKKYIKDVMQTTAETKDTISETKAAIDDITKQLTKLSSAQRTGLQTQILEKSKRIQLAIEAGNEDYSEELKQLIILYREYHLCGFNSQGKLYFNDTIDKASHHNNVLVRDLMNTYFSEYDPEK